MQPESDRLQGCARALSAARVTRKPITRVSETFGLRALDEAYAVAEINIAQQVAAGARVVGKKVGLTSHAVQAQLGVAQPDFGVLLDDMAYLDGEEIPFDRLIQPKVEAEVAFVVGRDLRTSMPSYAQFVASVEYALPALEIVDSAIAGWKITLLDTVADNASSGLFVLGNQPRRLGDDLGSMVMALDRNGRIASVGSGADCLGHPLRAAYWLACIMAERGTGLVAGEVILSGALGPMVALAAGDRIEARCGVLGAVSCSVSGGER